MSRAVRQQWAGRQSVVFVAMLLVAGVASTLWRVPQIDAAVPSSVGSVSLAVTSPAAGASGVVYAVQFTASEAGGLAQGTGTITIAAPSGTVFPTGIGTWTISDVTAGVSGWDDLGSTTSNGGATVTLPLLDVDVAPGDIVKLTSDHGTTNTSTLGAMAVHVSTSSDTIPATSNPIALVSASSAASVSLAVTSPAAGASGVVYAVQFTASETGRLAGGAGSITIAAPSGTVFPTGFCTWTITDVTTGSSGCDDLGSATSNAGATVTLPVFNVDIAPGDVVKLTSDHGTTSTSTLGSMTVQVSTSSDIVPATSDPIDISATGAVQSASVLVSTPVQGFPSRYEIAFSTTASGALVSQAGTVTVTAPATSLLPSSSEHYCFVSLTAGQEACTQAADIHLTASNQASVTVPSDVAPDANVVVSISGVQNANTTGPAQLSIITSSDQSPASAGFSLRAPTGAIARGVLTYDDNPVLNASVQACGSDAQCVHTTTDDAGLYVLPVAFGTVNVTAFPPPSGNGEGTLSVTHAAVTTKAAPVAILNLALAEPGGLPPGSSLTSGGDTTSSGQVPTINWFTSSTYHTAGCKSGFGYLIVAVTERWTGQVSRRAFPLTESPVGSGTYTATIPPLAPLHGTASVQPDIICAPPLVLIPSGGPISGGTRVLLRKVTAAPIVSITFGGHGGSNLHSFGSGLYAITSPSGTGDTSVNAHLKNGSTVSLGTFHYSSVSSLGSTTGPATGGGQITIDGTNFGSNPVVLFGLLPSPSVQVISSTQLRVTVPPAPDGGDVPVTVMDQGGVSEQLHYDYIGTALKIYDYDGPLNTAVSLLQAYGDLSDAATAADGVTELTNIVADQLLSALMPEGVTSELIGDVATYGVDACFAAGPECVLALAVVAAVVLLVKYLHQKGVFTLKVDPSGAVVDGNGTPVPGASATLLQQTAGGGFVPLASGSPDIDPSINPEITGSSGAFHWDVVPGTYEVQAVAPGCIDPSTGTSARTTSKPFPIPPPRTGLLLALHCTFAPRSSPVVGALNPSIASTAGSSKTIVTGAHLGGTQRVTVGGRSARFKVLSSAELEVTVPPGTGKVDLRVLTAAGLSIRTRSDRITYVTTRAADRTPPKVTIVRRPAPRITGSTVSIRFRGSDPHHPRARLRYICTLDRHTATCGVALVYRGLGIGKHHLSIVAVDASNNASVPVVVTWTVRVAATRR